MHPITAFRNQCVSFIRNEYAFVGSLGIGYAFGKWHGAIGVGAAYLVGKTIYQSCYCPPAVKNAFTRLFGSTDVNAASKQTAFLLEAALKKNPIDNFAAYSAIQKQDFLRRIPSKEWESLLKKIGELDRSLLSLDAIDAFQLGKWDHPIFKQQEWPLLTFYAYLEGLLEEKYLPKLILFDACAREASPHSGIRIFQLIDQQKNIDPIALSVLKRGMEGYFSEQCLTALVERFQKLPPEVSQFFEIHQPKRSRDVFWVLIQHAFYPFLCNDNSGKNYLQTVLPPEFIYEILKVRFGKTARKPNPVIGFFKKEKMSLIDQRVVSLSLYNHTKLPEKIDDVMATPLRHYQHDAIYHLFTDSANMHRGAWVEVANLFIRAGKHSVAVFVFDGDFPPYRSNIQVTPKALELCGKPLKENDELFWGTLIAVILSRCLNSTEEAVDLFWNYLQQHSEKWDENYGLSIGRLHQFLKNMSEKMEPPSQLCIDNLSSEHIMRMLALKAGLQTEFKLWNGYPSFEAILRAV